MLEKEEKLQIILNLSHLLRPTYTNIVDKFSYLPTSQKHDPSASQTPLYTKSMVCFKTGKALQTSSHNQIPSCVLSKDTSNTFQPTYLRYPDHPLLAVTPLTHFAIFVSKLCRLSSIARFKLFQNKPSIGKASLDLRQAQKKLKHH